MENRLSRTKYLEHNRTATVQDAASPPIGAQPLQFEVVQLQFIETCPSQPGLKKIQIPKLIYAIFLRVLYNFCYDMHWDLFSHRILVHKFDLFPDQRRCQIETWIARFRRQNLFPNASESELQDRARQLVMGYLI